VSPPPVALAVPIPEPTEEKPCEVGAPCPGEQALAKVKTEAENRVCFDEKAAVAISNLEDICDHLDRQGKGLAVLASNLDRSVTELTSDMAEVRAVMGTMRNGLTRVANVKWWLVVVLGAYETFKETGLSGVIKTLTQAALRALQ
jgi:hypothetical protein